MTSVDKAQWIEMYRRLEKPLYNVVYRVIWDAAESQDVVQEAFLRCWRRKEDLRADGFMALLYRTALNLASNRRRRVRLWRTVGVAAIDAGRRRERCRRADLARVRAAFDALPDALKHVVLLTEIAGMTYPEVAAALAIAEGTVGSREIARARTVARAARGPRSGFA